MKKAITVQLLTIITILLPVCTFGSADLTSRAQVDWVKGKVIARGVSSVHVSPGGEPMSRYQGHPLSMNEGRLMASKRAHDIAMEKLVNVIKTIKLDHEETISSFLGKSSYTRKSLSRLLREDAACRETPADYFHDSCRVEISLRAIISSLPFRFPAEKFPRRMDNPVSTDYTSVIVDTRGLKVTPMLFPSLLNKRGREVFSRRHVNIRRSGRAGIVAWVYTINAAMNHRRAGNHPFFTVALKKVRGCPVISERDVKKIYSSDKTLQHLRNCRLIFIIDRK